MIAEDQALLRHGLARLFEDDGHTVLGAYDHAEPLLAALADELPDLVVLDVRMPPTFSDEGTRAARDIKQRHPSIGVLVLSQHIERTHAVDLVAHPGFGYLLKDRVLDVPEFLDAARRVANGGSALDPNVVGALLNTRYPDNPLSSLSERERVVLGLMAQGLTNSAIARKVFVSERTVEGHIRHLMFKLDIADNEQAHRRVLAVLAHLKTAATLTTGT